jgi:hypothetical protein
MKLRFALTTIDQCSTFPSPPPNVIHARGGHCIGLANLTVATKVFKSLSKTMTRGVPRLQLDHGPNGLCLFQYSRHLATNEGYTVDGILLSSSSSDLDRSTAYINFGDVSIVTSHEKLLEDH